MCYDVTYELVNVNDVGVLITGICWNYCIKNGINLLLKLEV